MFNIEGQDVAGLASLGVSGYLFHTNLKNQGLTYSSMWNAYKRGARYRGTGMGTSGQLFAALHEAAYAQSQALDVARSTSIQGMLQGNLEGMEEAVRMGIMETMSRPSFQGRLAPNAYQETFNRIRSASATGLKTEIESLMASNGNIPEFGDYLLRSIQGRAMSRYKGQSYQSMLKGQAADYTLNRVSGFDFTKPVTQISSRSQAASMFGGRKGYWGQFEKLVGRLEKEKIVAPGYMKRAFNDGLVFTTDNGSAYARVKTNRGDFNVPLKRNTMQTIAGDVPIYHGDIRGRTRYSFVQNYFKAGANGRLETGADGKLLRMGFEDAIFFDDDAAIFKALEQAGTTGDSVMSRLAGIGDFDPEAMFRYGEYLTDDISGQMVAINRQSMAAVMGYKELMESGDPSDILRNIESQLGKEGISAYAAASPGATGNLGAFHILDSNSPVSGLGAFADPGNMSGQRRPLQGLTRPWGITNMNTFSKGSFGRINKGGWVHNPVSNPLLETDVYRSMMENSVARKALDPQFSTYSMPTLWDLKGGALDLAEGAIGVKPNQYAPEFAANMKVHKLARPNAQFESVKMAEIFSRDGGLLDAANAYTNPEERRAELGRILKKSNKDWSDGYWLGQKFDATRGLVDEYLDIGGKGANRLYDIVPTETGYNLMFQKHTPWGGGLKMFGMLKGVTTFADIEGYGKQQGLGSLAERVQAVAGAGELDKANQFAQVRTQQATGMRHILARNLGMTGGGTSTNAALNLLSQEYTGGPNTLFSRLEGRGGKVARKMGLGVNQNQTYQLLGLVDMAFENRAALSDTDLGLIFGAEKGKSGVLGELLPKIGAQYGDDFAWRMAGSVAGATSVYGEAMTFFRDTAGLFLGSRPRMERRAVEALINADANSFVRMGSISERDVLLGDIAAGVELPNQEYLEGIKQLKRGYQSKGGKLGRSIQDMVGTPGPEGRYYDVSPALGPKAKGVYMPSQTLLAKLAPAIDTSGMLDPIQSDYGRALARFADAASNWDTEGGVQRLEDAVSAVRRHENAIFHSRGQATFSGRMMHSSYEMVGPRRDIRDYTDMVPRQSRRATEGFGMVATMSRERAEAMYERSLNHFKPDSSMHAELLRQKKLVMSGKSYGAMAVMRSPSTNERARQLMAFRIDDAITDDQIYMGRRIVDGEEVGAWSATAGSADYDGDRAAYNLIAGKNSKAAFDMVNDLETLRKLALDREAHVVRHAAVETAISNAIDRVGGAEPLTDFVSSMRSLAGQADIGMLSYNIDKLKYAARASRHDWGVGSKLSDANYNAFEKVLYGLEQEGIKFKHGRNITQMITSDLGGLSDLSNVDNMKLGLRNALERWVGPELFNKGIEFSEGGVKQRLRLDENFLDQMTTGLTAMGSDEARAAHDLARKKLTEIRAINPERYEEMIRLSKGQASDVYALAGRIVDDFMAEDVGGMTVRESMVAGMNNALKQAAADRRAGMWGRAAKPLGVALTGGALVYSMFDRGYSSTELEAPTPSPDGRPTSSPIALKMAIQGGELLREERGGPAWNRGQNQPMPMPSGSPGLPSVPNSIPTKSYIDNNTGRISVRAMVPSNVDSQQFADRLRVSMPHAQVGVNVSHQHVMPRDLTHEL